MSEAKEETNNLRDWADGVRNRIFWAANAIEAAEQRAADIETRTAVKLGEFAKITDIIDAECKRLGIEWHGSASTTLKAVIEAQQRGITLHRLFVEDGQVRSHFNQTEIRKLDQLQLRSAIFLLKLLEREFIPEEPSPAPAEEPERKFGAGQSCGEPYIVNEMLAADDHAYTVLRSGLTVDDAENIAAFLNGTLHATIREQAAEIERLRTKIANQHHADYRDCLEVAGAIADAVESYDGDDLLEQITPHLKPLVGELESLRSQLQQATEQGERAKRLLEQSRIHSSLKNVFRLRDEAIEALAAPQPEAKGASEPAMVPVFVKRVDGAPPMTAADAESLANSISEQQALDRRTRHLRSCCVGCGRLRESDCVHSPSRLTCCRAVWLPSKAGARNLPRRAWK